MSSTASLSLMSIIALRTSADELYSLCRYEDVRMYVVCELVLLFVYMSDNKKLN